jgi:hypothetical protein
MSETKWNIIGFIVLVLFFLLCLMLPWIDKKVFGAIITLSSPSRNVTVTYRGVLIQDSPTASVKIGSKTYTMTASELVNLRDIANTMYTPGPAGVVMFNITIAP